MAQVVTVMPRHTGAPSRVTVYVIAPTLGPAEVTDASHVTTTFVGERPTAGARPQLCCRGTLCEMSLKSKKSRLLRNTRGSFPAAERWRAASAVSVVHRSIAPADARPAGAQFVPGADQPS